MKRFQLHRLIKLIEQGIRQRKLPMFALYTTFDPSRSDVYLGNKSSNDGSLTLTEIFHQFDTITLRGRTSIDKHLNDQNSEDPSRKMNISFLLSRFACVFLEIAPVSHIPRSSQLQSISQNQGQTPLTSPSNSRISDLAIPLNNLFKQTTILRLNETSNPVREKRRFVDRIFL